MPWHGFAALGAGSRSLGLDCDSKNPVACFWQNRWMRRILLRTATYCNLQLLIHYWSLQLLIFILCWSTSDPHIDPLRAQPSSAKTAAWPWGTPPSPTAEEVEVQAPEAARWVRRPCGDPVEGGAGDLHGIPMYPHGGWDGWVMEDWVLEFVGGMSNVVACQSIRIRYWLGVSFFAKLRARAIQMCRTINIL